MSNLLHEISIRGIKIIDIGFLFTLASIIGYTIARLLSKFFVFNQDKYTKDEKGKVILKCKIKLGIQILLEMGLIGIILYLSRQIIQMIPFPLDGAKGFNAPPTFKGFIHRQLREYGNPYPIAFFIILFQDQLKKKIAYFTEINKF